MVFHLSILLLVLNHFDMLPWISLVPETSRHMLGAGLVGVGVTVPLFYFFIRRFRSPYREISVPSDYLLLLILIFLALFGDLMSWGNSWTTTGFLITKQDFARYFGELASFSFADPRAYLNGTHFHFLVIHVFLADLFFLVLPFSKIVHTFLSYPINLLRRK
jgi:nitrate reductase gamma subunit